MMCRRACETWIRPPGRFLLSTGPTGKAISAFRQLGISPWLEENDNIFDRLLGCVIGKAEDISDIKAISTDLPIYGALIYLLGSSTGHEARPWEPRQRSSTPMSGAGTTYGRDLAWRAGSPGIKMHSHEPQPHSWFRPDTRKMAVAR